jgi:hypothetical protein
MPDSYPLCNRREVAVDGVVRIPKTVFESDPMPASSDVVATVRRIDGTVEELKSMAPDNPNFQPRKPTPGRVKAINKDEVRLRPSTVVRCQAALALAILTPPSRVRRR